MKSGDLWLVNIPELGTHEQSGVRPAVVIARVTKTIATIIPCTTNRRALRFPFTYQIEPSKRNGLKETSVALIFHLRAIDISYFSEKLGELEKNALSDIRKHARLLIG